MEAPVYPLEPTAPAPETLASPFAPGPPHPLAEAAARALQARLTADAALRAALARPGGGKMFGVLVTRDGAGRLGWLAAFSGQLLCDWWRPGFAPPLFDPDALAAFWPAGEAALATQSAACAALDEALAEAEQVLAAVEAAARAQRAALRAVHSLRKAARHAARAAGAPDGPLAAASRADKAEARQLAAHHAAARAPHAARRDQVAQERAAAHTARAARSRALQTRIHACYHVGSFAGETTPLAALYPAEGPPSGAGDCAAPKLLAAAQRQGLRPVALAEFWWGAPPTAGDRRPGAFYPACRGKCGPLLPYMLRGLPVAAPPRFGAHPPERLPILHADPWLIVVDKPAGLLSVPGRGPADSVQRRLEAAWAGPDGGPWLVHRLDLDTSGLLLAARTRAAHAALQAQLTARSAEKRYVAVVAGELTDDRGRITLALRGDPHDRPRQIHDPVHGKPAITDWAVRARAPGQTRLDLWPRTGRTHQLRLHAAHPQGLNAPILGDRLYGPPGPRLLLHAESLWVDHPADGARVGWTSPAPF